MARFEDRSGRGRRPPRSPGGATAALDVEIKLSLFLVPLGQDFLDDSASSLAGSRSRIRWSFGIDAPVRVSVVVFIVFVVFVVFFRFRFDFNLCLFLVFSL